MTTLKQYENNRYSRILGYGASRGEVIVHNNDIVEAINSSDEWIKQRTGISTRHRASENQTVNDLAIAAAHDALANSHVTGEQIDAVIISTISHPYATPSLAVLVADAIGSRCPAYDISAACAGFCYGIAQADAMVRSGMAQNVLVIGVEKLSDFIDNTERSISFLLGDGAGAAVVSVSDEPGIAPTIWGSDGSRWGTVGMTHSLLDIRNRDFVANPVQEDEKIWPTLRQDGPSVFRWAVWEMAKVAQQALESAGITPDELDALIPHQANARIIDQMAKTLKMSLLREILRMLVTRLPPPFLWQRIVFCRNSLNFLENLHYRLVLGPVLHMRHRLLFFRKLSRSLLRYLNIPFMR